MSSAAGHAYDTAQAFLNEREAGIVNDMGRRAPVSFAGDHFTRIESDLANQIRLGEDAGCHGSIGISQFQQIHFGGAQRRRGVGQ